MHVTLVAAITFDGRLRPLPAAPPLPKMTRVAAFQDGRRAATVCHWHGKLGARERVQCEINRPAAWSVAAALLTAGLVNELRLTVCPLLSGRREAATLTGPPTPEFLPAGIRLRLISMEPAGEVCVLRYAAASVSSPVP